MIDTSKIKTHWDLIPLLEDETDATLKSELAKIESKCTAFVSKWKPRDDYLTQPETLKEALDELEKLSALGYPGGNVGYYYGLKSALFSEDPIIKAKQNIIEEQTLRLGSEMEFFMLRVAKISDKLQPAFLANPALVNYKHFLEVLFANSKYNLSEAEERILTLYSPNLHSNWTKMTSEFLSAEEREVLDESGKIKRKNFSDLMNLLSCPDVKVRDGSAAALDDIFSKHIKVGEAELNAVLTTKKTSDGVRGFNRPDAARHLADDVDSSVVDALLAVVSDRFDVVHKYYELKAKLLSLAKLKYYERNILYKGMDMPYPFEKGAQLAYKTFANLDSQFAVIFESFLYSGQIDVFTKKGKTGGAFCASGSNKQPIYVLLNYGDKVDDVSTIAHEMGHAINDELVKASRHSLEEDVPLCLAETASTFFEDFVLDELSLTMDDESKLALAISRLDDAMNTVFRQVACYKFEQDLHSNFREKGFLSKDDIGELFIKNMAAYCGTFVEMTSQSKNWWLHWSHIRSFFYVYSYAFGYLVSKNLQGLVKKDKRNIAKVKTFLSAGSHKSPKEILADLGINIENKAFWQAGVEEIEKMLNETIDLANKLGKI